LKTKTFTVILASTVIFLQANTGYSQTAFDLETGLVKSGYNDVRIPGNTGTLFSLSKDLKADNTFFYRIRLNYSLNARSTFSILFAPLTITSTGKLDKGIQFREAYFPTGSDINATYKFNSYRLTYRYEIYRTTSIDCGLGLTGKIRDAKIELKSASLESAKKNVGFVPLVNFRFFYRFNRHFGALVSGDALAAPQGRAEDVLAALTYGKTDKFRVKVGYRILEGGADNDEVYTFALFHYAVLGLTAQL
jgi:hypothetical protein